MLITLDLTEPMVANSALDATIYSQALTDLTFSVQNPVEADLNGLSCVLLSTDGVTLAHAIISENKAVLDTNTTECIDYVSSLQVDAKNTGYLVIGESERPRAIVAVEVAKNFIANSAPPQSVAGMYPTSDALNAIITQMTAQAQRAEDAVEATETAQKAVAEYVDEVFPAKVEQAEKTLENAVTDGESAIAQKANQAIGAISSHTATIVTSLDQKQTQIEASLDGKVTEATTAIDGKVTEANDAKDDAVKAQTAAETAKGQAEGFAEDASTSATRAEIALNNGCVYEVRDIADASFTVDKTITIYKHEPIADTAYNFATPTDVSGKVCVFWLWIAMGETAVQLTMQTSVTFIGSEPSFGANSETMLAFMSTDGGASWMANVQWEKAVSV